MLAALGKHVPSEQFEDMLAQSCKHGTQRRA